MVEEVLAHLEAAVDGTGPDEAKAASALRLRVRLQPAGGSGAKAMPPTYSGDRGPVYVTEQRLVDGEDQHCVLLDSNASQANRMEAVLDARMRAQEIRLPDILVDQAEFGVNSALLFPHRCFDAWVEDALLGDQRFGDTEEFDRLSTVISRRRATPLMTRFPVGLVLGCWASRKTNPQGTTRIARALSSEIIAVQAVSGSRPSSRIDRHHVSADVAIYESSEPHERFTTDPDRAVQARGKPRLFDEKGRPSEAGYGNVTPSLAQHGGITMAYALQLATVSLPALRESSFPSEGGQAKRERDVAGRLMLAALALRLLSLQAEAGLDLRSGCLLIPEEEPAVELIGRLGRQVATWPLYELDAAAVLAQAIERGAAQGLAWDTEPLRLRASDPQLELLRRSLADEDASGG